MHNKKSFIQKIKDFKAKLFRKKISKREKRIELLKEIDNTLALANFESFSFKNKSSQPYVQKRLNKIEGTLTKIKRKYLAAEAKDDTAKRLDPYEKISVILGTVSYTNLSLKNQSKDAFIQKKLDHIEKALLKHKRKYENYIKTHSEQGPKAKQLYQNFEKELQTQIKKIENQISHLQNDNRVVKLQREFQLSLEKQIYKVKVEIAHLNHKNKVTEDKLWWQLLSKKEQKERRSDLSFYIPDVQGYWLTLLSVVAEIIYLILLLSIMVRTFWVGITILVNIVFLLFLFTIAIKVKNYKKAFSICSIVFGIYCLVRILWVIQGLMGVDLSSTSATKRGYIYGCNIYMIVASIYVGIRSFSKIKRQEIYIKEDKISKIQMSK